MTTKRSWRPLAGLAMLASLGGMPLPVAAQGRYDGPPPPAEIATMQARDADDVALLLALRPDQRPALAAFLQSMMPPPPPRRDGRGPNGQGPGAASAGDGFAQHLDRMMKDAARHAADDTRRIAATRTFYDGLDATQRRAFEALMRLRHGLEGDGPHGPTRHGPTGPMPDAPRRGGEALTPVDTMQPAP